VNFSWIKKAYKDPLKDVVISKGFNVWANPGVEGIAQTWNQPPEP